MATMKRSKDARSEQSNQSATIGAGYNRDIDAIREKEFPMVQGRLAEILVLEMRDSLIL